jgi:hypothetical protein
MLVRIAFDLDGDPDLAFHYDADLDPAPQNYAEANSQHRLYDNQEVNHCSKKIQMARKLGN